MSTYDSTSDSVTTKVIVISITSLLVVAVLFSTCGLLVGMIIQKAIYRYKGKQLLADDPVPTSVTHTSELTPVYEDSSL